MMQVAAFIVAFGFLLTAAEQVSLRASKAVELAGKDLDEQTREVFYRALESITTNLTILSKVGIPD